MSASKILWRSVDEDLPDDDQTVLIHLQCGEVWTGFHHAGQWRFCAGDMPVQVLHWAPFPEPPLPALFPEPPEVEP